MCVNLGQRLSGLVLDAIVGGTTLTRQPDQIAMLDNLTHAIVGKVACDGGHHLSVREMWK